MLSHADQLRRLEAEIPAAAEVAVVAGDPCFDRLTASVPFRDRYRSALGVGDRTLVVLTSTWSSPSLLGSRPQLPRELVAELSPDRYVVALVLHPNISHGHGRGAVRQWYADCLRSGMLVLDELDGWRAGLVAADLVIGDHGSVTGYAAALGRPTLLGAFDDVPPSTPISVLGDTAGRLPVHGPYAPAISAAVESRATGRFAPVADLVTSVPGESLALLRKSFYSLLDLAEPAGEPAVVPVSSTGIALSGPSSRAHLVTHECDAAHRIIRMSRRPAEVQRPAHGVRPSTAADTHISCWIDYPIRTLRTTAAVLTCRAEDPGRDPAHWHHTVFTRHPRCTLSAVLNEDAVSVRMRDGTTLTLRAADVAPEALASVPFAWSAAGLDPAGLGPSVQLELDERVVVVRVQVD
ncbi:hypothetical protein [Amycolatopsis sp. SID8362]|uniref:hypothetical protein n=1 Tax=Amycolatopsis sp. SID8362 TaxID=2690346 RepID=UPI00136BFF76|nr:hypothetical protein [Amycolatopsis sp. SID8362]NBH02577.1 hypothetical protein [Amycolatopsis sp. SID8362]NED39279.1 hypothetical protein [Amycolatopsis sp. SID8362]